MQFDFFVIVIWSHVNEIIELFLFWWIDQINTEHSSRPLTFYRPKDGKEDLGPHGYAIRNSWFSFHARVHGDLSVSIRLASPYECGSA